MITLEENIRLSEDFKLEFNIYNPYEKGTFEHKYLDHFCNGSKLEAMEEFITSRLHFQEFGVYTNATPNSHPNSQWMKFWKEEQRRCLEGYNIGRDFIPGYLYFYWNYSPIYRVKEVSQEKDTTRKRAERVWGFPDIYDSDYFWFHYIEEAEKRGQHGANIKKRGIGYSFKGGSMLCRNYFLIPGSRSYAVADQKEYLIKDGILTKAWELMDWLDNNTAWTKRRLKNSEMFRKAGYQKKLKTGAMIDAGYKSEILGVTLEGNSDKIRGKRGKLILWEESGNNVALRQAWIVARSSMEEDDATYGTMVAFGTGGCVCAGTKVWNNKGELVKIEELVIFDGILGYDNSNCIVSKEDITYWQLPTEKQCFKIITNTGRELRCSNDHPILKFYNKNKQEFIATENLHINDEICVIDEVSIFGNNKMWNPRLIGWLIGDGTYGHNQTVRLSNCEEEITNYIETNFDAKINIERQTKLKKVYKELRIKGIRPELRKLGIIDQTKLNKTFPINIHSYCKEDLQEFIGGLFDTDGYVNFRKNKNKHNWIIEISISSASKNLLEELRFLLQKFGIHGRIRERLPRENNILDKNSWFEFTIADIKSAKRFANYITLFPKEKQNRLDKIKSLNIKSRKDYKGFRIEKIKSIENIGILPIYNLTAGNTNTYIANGIITHNTEGANFEGLEELIRKPNGYNIYGIPNIFENKVKDKVGFFIPTYLNRRDCMDNNGNSDIIKAVTVIDAQRRLSKYNTTSSIYLRTIAEHPYTIDEAVLRMESSPFDTALAREVLSELKTKSKSFAEPGEFIVDKDGKIQWRNDFSKRPIEEFPSKEDNLEGCWVIYNKPDKGKDIPSWRYLGGQDPIDKGYEETNSDNKHSLAATYIIDTFTRNIVAEYVGRPNVAEAYYEQVWRGLEYYNAELLYENQLKGLFTYFRSKNKVHLLANEPESLKDKWGYKPNDKVKGFHATPEINRFARELIHSWSLEQVVVENNAETNEPITVPRMYMIPSIALLQEICAWNSKGNFDRISGLGATLILLQDREKNIEAVRNKIKSRFDDKFFKRINVLKRKNKWV